MADEPKCDRLLVYQHGERTKTIPWRSDLPVAQDLDIFGALWHLIADTKVICEADDMQARVRAWNATRGSKEAA
jgi:hypothetical protein